MFELFTLSIINVTGLPLASRWLPGLKVLSIRCRMFIRHQKWVGCAVVALCSLKILAGYFGRYDQVIVAWESARRRVAILG
jgi:hypothetical protein